MLRIILVIIILSLGAWHYWSAPIVRPDAPPAQQAAHQDVSNSNRSLTSIIAYIKTNHSLPNFYLTKKEAAARGWVPSQGNLADVAPGMMIGGDEFTNSQDLLPQAPGRRWYEADFDYVRGERNAKRIVYSSDGLVYVTYNHYKTVHPQ